MARKSSKGENESTDSKGKMSKFAKRLNRFMPKVARASVSSHRSSVDDSSSCNSHDVSATKKESFKAVPRNQMPTKLETADDIIKNNEEEGVILTTDNFELEDHLLAAFEGSIPPMSNEGMIFDD